MDYAHLTFAPIYTPLPQEVKQSLAKFNKKC